MNLKIQIEKARGDAAELERLFRETKNAGNETAFNQAIEQCLKDHPRDILLLAWAYRLGILPISSSEMEPDSTAMKKSQARRWWGAVAISIVLGGVYALFAGNKPPVPVPGEAAPLFWIGWSPATALAIVFYLAMFNHTGKRMVRYAFSAVFLILIAAVTAFMVWGRTDDIAALIALHLPLVAWAAIGTIIILGQTQPAGQCYAFLVKSVETVLVGGIFFGAGALFLGLTFGIFSVIGVNLLVETDLQKVAAWGVGAIPVLALATVYNPFKAPLAQDWTTGLTRILTILTLLLLPLALAVLFAYVFYFVPVYFWRPFQQREVLIVYNATILAILVLLTIVVSGPEEARSSRYDAILRYSVFALGGLTLVLNIYALAANLSRIVELGLTPNRYAVLGWNVVTLLMLGIVAVRQWRDRAKPWAQVFRQSIAGVSALPVVWALWVLFGLPLWFK